MKSNHGFTLLELMVAMAIFAMLAVAGWQVFDSVNRARERARRARQRLGSADSTSSSAVKNSSMRIGLVR